MKYLFFALAILEAATRVYLKPAVFSPDFWLIQFWEAFFILCALIAYKADQIRDAIKNK